ncbi:MAG: DinB family protein [Planctomycetota bacterium]|jgi:uncharacterized damage-inducible protein DinB
MDAKSRVDRQLRTIREVSEQMLSAFETPDHWTHQVHDKANHALWFAGHLGTVDNFLISNVAPERAAMKAGYQEKFGMGSRPTSNPADYPDVDEVLDFMRERRGVLLEVLSGLTDDDMAKPTPDGAPDVMPDVGSMFELAVWHEALHLGQVTVARRDLGHPPVVDAPPPADDDT